MGRCRTGPRWHVHYDHALNFTEHIRLYYFSYEYSLASISFIHNLRNHPVIPQFATNVLKILCQKKSKAKYISFASSFPLSNLIMSSQLLIRFSSLLKGTVLPIYRNRDKLSKVIRTLDKQGYKLGHKVGKPGHCECKPVTNSWKWDIFVQNWIKN